MKNLTEIIKTEEFKNFWATKAVKENWTVTATKNTITIWYDYKRKDIYVKFFFEEVNDEFGNAIFVSTDLENNINAKYFDCGIFGDEMEHAKECMCHFVNRY